MIKIQEDYWTGTKCIENEVPWMVPGAINYLDSLCKLNNKVLEIGTGGSTLFFARRCQCVMAIETNRNWYFEMQKILAEKNITNVKYLLIESQKEIENVLTNMETNFDMISVDSVHGYNRSIFLDILLEKQKNIFSIILDNYSESILFPKHYDKTISEMIELVGSGWDGKDFNDPKWTGSGTRILNRCLNV